MLWHSGFVGWGLSISRGHKTSIFRIAADLLLTALAACLTAGICFANEPGAKPVAQIDLAPLGYGGLSAAARQSGGSNLSVDFLDSDHVLLTFNPKKLFKRLPDCPPTHADRQVHALVMEVPSGKVVKEADWYLHDVRRYVWPLGERRILLRRLNKLYEVNANLEEKLVFDSPKELLWVSVTPDGKQIIVETSVEPTPHDNGKAADSINARNKDRVKVSFLDANTLAVLRTIDVRGTIKLEGTSAGVADVRKQGGNWLVEFGNANIARVKARRAPNLLYSSANTLLVGRCSVSRDGYSVSAFTITGHFLWRQHWQECRYAPVVRASADGSRFAAGTVTIRSQEGNVLPTGVAEEGQQEGLDQHVQVLDTATGTSILELTTAPAVPDGQNFSLSTDGSLLAVIAGTSMDVYKLAEMPDADRARSLAVKADTPGLNVPPSSAGKPAPLEQTVYVSSADLEAEPSAPAKESALPTTADAATTAAPSVPAATSESPAAKSAAAPTLTIRTGTQVVAVDVVVTDSAGHLVKGLQQSDFSVAEDGKPQTLRYFKEFADTQPPTSAPAPPSKEALPPNMFSNYSASSEQGAVTVVLLDLLNTPIADQAYAQDQLVKFLKNKPKDAKFAMCILGNRLQMIQGFTDDQNVLLAAATGKKASQRHRPLKDPDSVLPMSLEAARATVRFVPGLSFFVESVALQQSEARLVEADQRMTVTVDAFAHLARYLAGIPGRKNLVWLSGSFLLGIYPEPNGTNPFMETHTYGENLKKVANLLGEAHVSVYPVDVKGLETNPLFSAASNDALAPISMQGSFSAGPGGARGAPRGATPSPNANTAVPIAIMQDQMQQFDLTQMDEHATMKQLATQTGGQAFFNTNGIAQAIKTATEQGSNYYALSYTPANKNYNGGFRKIKVALGGKKYHLAYRSGYYAIDPAAPPKASKDLSSGLARAAMQQGSPQSRQIVFGARVVPIGKPRIVQNSPVNAKPSRKRKQKDSGTVEMQRYAIDHAVTFSDLHFNSGTDGAYHDVVNFMVTVFDEEGKLTASQLSQTSADLKPEALRDVMAGGLRIHQEIDVPVKSAVMRLGVEDLSNSHIGTMEVHLPVPPLPEGQDVARRSLPPVEPD